MLKGTDTCIVIISNSQNQHATPSNDALTKSQGKSSHRLILVVIETLDDPRDTWLDLKDCTVEAMSVPFAHTQRCCSATLYALQQHSSVVRFPNTQLPNDHYS